MTQQSLAAERKHLSTSSTLQNDAPASLVRKVGEDGEAIRGNNRDGGMSENDKDKIFYARLVPNSPSYFTAQPNFTDDLLAMQAMAAKYASLPRIKPSEAPRVAWVPLHEYRDIVNEKIQASQYEKILKIVASLNLIHPSLMPWNVKQVVNQYKRDINPFQNVAKPGVVDNSGRACGHGRRKTSTAKAWLIEGTGEVLINGKSLSEAFGRIHDRESVIWGLKATDRIDKYNVWGISSGGGTTGQAEALTLAVAKALMVHEPDLKPALRRGTSTFSLL